MKIQTKRILAAFVDFLYIHSISLAVSFGIMYKDITDAYVTVIFYMVMCGILFTFKDCVFKYASIGKRIFKLKIVHEKFDSINIATYILRAIPLLFVPIELIMLLKSNRRLGDILSKTRVESK